MSINDLVAGSELAGRLLRYPVEEALENSEEVPEIDAFYYCQAVRGGGQILIARDGSVLFGISALSFDEMVADFKSGMRTDLSEFRVD